MAYISGMCQSQRRCSVAQDTGLDVAVTIAHELGHKYVENLRYPYVTIVNNKYPMQNDREDAVQNSTGWN